MDRQQLEKEVRSALEDGYKPSEVAKAMRQQGYEPETVKQAVRKAQRERSQGRNLGQRNQRKTQQQKETASKTAPTQPKDTVKGIELHSRNYKLKQSLIRNKYSLYDKQDQLVLKAKQKLFKLKEDIPFKDSEGNILMRVKAQQVMDVAGDYMLKSEVNDENIAVLEKKWSFLHHRWKIKEPGGGERLLAKISSRGGIDVLRFLGGAIPYFPNFFALIPHAYDIENPQGEKIGEIKGHFGIRDIYDLEVDANEHIQETIVASAVAIDALEDN